VLPPQIDLIVALMGVVCIVAVMGLFRINYAKKWYALLEVSRIIMTCCLFYLYYKERHILPGKMCDIPLENKEDSGRLFLHILIFSINALTIST
jgi:hypothetical protein